MQFNLRKDYAGKKQEQAQKQAASQNLSESARSLLEPKEIEVNGYKFIISKMPCTVAQEVIYKLPAGLIPLISEFSQAEEMLFKMLSYCERVYTDGRPCTPLISKTVIDNHVPDFKTLRMLEWECMKYNFDFFANGSALAFLNKGVSLAKSNVSEILTDLLGKLSLRGEQLFGNSNTDTL